jgi:dihydropteroate synthase
MGYELAQYGAVTGEVRRAAVGRGSRRGGGQRARAWCSIGLVCQRTEHSIAVLAGLGGSRARLPVLVNPSRKRFTGEVAGGLRSRELRVRASASWHGRGAAILRVHDVAPVRRAVALAEAVRLAART